MNTNNNSDSSSFAVPTTYQAAFAANGGHTWPMWLAMAAKCAMSTVGIGANLTLVAATLRSDKLRSVCNWLIALETACMAIFSANQLVTFWIALLRVNFVRVSSCFWLQIGPLFGLLMAFPVMFQIGLERLGSILFPIWSMRSRSKAIHVCLLVFSFGTALYLAWLAYIANESVDAMVYCQISDVTTRGLFYTVSFDRTVTLHILLVSIYLTIWLILTRKGYESSQHFSKSIFKSLCVLVAVEVFGWFPSIFLGKVMIWLGLNPLQSTYMSTAYSIIPCVNASNNMPVLYKFNHSYRSAIDAFLHDLGLKRATVDVNNALVSMNTGHNIQRTVVQGVPHQQQMRRIH